MSRPLINTAIRSLVVPLVLSVTAPAARAVAEFDSVLQFNLEVLSIDGDILVNALTESSETSDADGSGMATVDAVVIPENESNLLAGELASFSALASGTASSPGQAAAVAFAGGEIAIDNQGTTPGSVEFALTYSGSVFADANAPAGELAEASVALLLAGDEAGSLLDLLFEPLDDGEILVLSIAPNAFNFSIDLEGGALDVLIVEGIASGTASANNDTIAVAEPSLTLAVAVAGFGVIGWRRFQAHTTSSSAWRRSLRTTSSARRSAPARSSARATCSP